MIWGRSVANAADHSPIDRLQATCPDLKARHDASAAWEEAAGAASAEKQRQQHGRLQIVHPDTASGSCYLCQRANRSTYVIHI